MGKYYYTTNHKSRKRRTVRFLGLTLCITGIVLGLYVFSPIVSYYALQHVYASTSYTTPIPKSTIVNTSGLKTVLAATANRFTPNVDYTNAQNWFPNFRPSTAGKPRVEQYTISIPEIGLKSAIVSTVDYEVGKHLVNYGGTAIPPEKGNAVVFGHSTLPQLFKQNDYKTVFARLHTLTTGDNVVVTVDNVAYTYKIFQISVIDADDFGPLTQEYDNSYLTLITCTPPGTTWQRLVLKARLEKL